ncbi:Uncharacterised protein [Neisseria meningitidis]|nr:Uncharacterised protein [Neisseria meningitidis]
MGLRVGMRNPAGHLARVHFGVAAYGHDGNGRVAGLFGQLGKVNRASVDARRRAGFQTALRQLQFAQTSAQRFGGGVAGASAFVVFQTDVDFAGQKRACGQHDGACFKLHAHRGNYAADAFAVERYVFDGLLEKVEVFLVFQHFADGGFVQNAVGLRARGSNCRAFAGVQAAELDTGFVGGQRHCAAERVEFAYQMPFADAADGRVA